MSTILGVRHYAWKTKVLHEKRIKESPALIVTYSSKNTQ